MAFFLDLWPDGIPGTARLVVCDAEFRSRWCRNLEDAARATALGGNYFSVAAMSGEAEHPGSRGSGHDAVALPGLWLDLDCKEGRHAQAALPSREDALAFLQGLPLGPSRIIDSGGGFHVYWLFKETWFLSGEADRREAERLSHAWQGFVLDQAKARGWQLDVTADLARLLRIPGTVNAKYVASGSSLVTTVLSEGQRYAAHDFQEWVDLAPSLDIPAASPSATEIELPKALPVRITLALEATGWPFSLKLDRAERLRCVVLDYCPVCGGRQQTTPGFARGTAHVSPIEGRLVCKRETCAARGQGLPFQEWTGRFLSAERLQRVLASTDDVAAWRRRLGSASSTQPADARQMARTDARQGVASVLWEAVKVSNSGSTISLVVVPVGGGKTEAAIDLMAEDGRVAYFAPNHDLLGEVESKLRAKGVESVLFMGAERACHYQEGFKAAGGRRDWRGLACPGCPELSHCAAWAVHRPGTVILAPFQLFNTLRNAKDNPLEGRTILIDEPVGFVSRRSVGTTFLEGLRSEHWTPPHDATARAVHRALGHLLASALQERERRGKASQKSGESRYADRMYGSELAAFWQREMETTWLDTLRALASLDADAYPTPLGMDLREQVIRASDWPSPDLRDSLRAIVGTLAEDQEARRWAQECGRVELVMTDKRAWLEVLRIDPLQLWPDKGAVLLDATGLFLKPEAEAAHPGRPVQVFAADVQSVGGTQCVWVRSGIASRRRVEAQGEEALARLGREIRRARAYAIRVFSQPTPRLAVLTHKDLAQALREADGLPATDLPDLPAGWYWRHDRGTNAYEGVDVLLTYGDPLEALGAVQAEARVLGLDATELAEARARASLAQAHGRARWLHRRVLLWHVGNLLPPDWGVRWLHRERPEDVGHPSVLTLIDARADVAAALIECGWVADWPPDLLVAQLGQNPLGEILLEDFVHAPESAGRSYRRGVREVVRRVRGAKRVEVRVGMQLGCRLWCFPGQESRASAEAASLLELIADRANRGKQIPREAWAHPCADWPPPVPASPGESYSDAGWDRSELMKAYGSAVTTHDGAGRILPRLRRLAKLAILGELDSDSAV